MSQDHELKTVKTPGEIEILVTGLQSADPVRRDAAVGRLRIIGSRAVARLAALVESPSTPSSARIAALSALEGIDDRRVADPALAALASSDDPDTARAAAAVLRHWVAREPGTHVLDALAAAATDDRRPSATRRAALDALTVLPAALVEPIRVRAGLLDHAPAPFDDAAAAREWVAAHGHDAPLSELHDLVVRARDRERADAPAARRAEWLSARGAAHAALARRGSRVAIYDLRETFDSGTLPLPLDFLAAAAAVGDASCLEPMARHWAQAAQDPWWRERLAAAAAEVVHRTRLSGRSALMRRLRAKWSGFV